jgi:hypothetical protein
MSVQKKARQAAGSLSWHTEGCVCCRVLHHTNLSTAARHSSGSCESTYSARDVRASMHSSTTPTCRVTRWKGVRWTSAGAGMRVRVRACVRVRVFVCVWTRVCDTQVGKRRRQRKKHVCARARTHTRNNRGEEHARAHTSSHDKHHKNMSHLTPPWARERGLHVPLQARRQSVRRSEHRATPTH